MSPSRRRATGAVRGLASRALAAPRRVRRHRGFPFSCPIAVRPTPARTTRAALQVEHVESFACRGLPAGAPRPRHGARQGCAPGAMSLSRRVLHPHIIRATRCLAAGPPGSARCATPVRGLASRPPSPGSRCREHLTRPK